MITVVGEGRATWPGLGVGLRGKVVAGRTVGVVSQSAELPCTGRVVLVGAVSRQADATVLSGALGHRFQTVSFRSHRILLTILCV